MGSFRCGRCGVCCTSLVRMEAGNVFGIYLAPDEVAQFPPESVFPLFGSGNPVQVIAYQMGEDRCPNYRESGGIGSCRVYDRRPLVCAAFPVISRARVSDGCPAVRRLIDGVDRTSLVPELAAHERKLLELAERPVPEWAWPLNKKHWIPYPG